MANTIIIERELPVSKEVVFDALINPEKLVKWHHAGGGWVTPYAEVDPTIGGQIKIGYSDAEGKQTFDLIGTITAVDINSKFAYVMGLGADSQDEPRKVEYQLQDSAAGSKIRLEFDMEHTNSRELQLQGWSEHIDNLQKIL